MQPNVHLLAGLCADLPKYVAYINTHNCTINIEGKPGQGKPINQMMEHYVLYVGHVLNVCMHCTHIKHIIHAHILIFSSSRVLKQTMKAEGNLSPNHIDLSLCALFLMSAAKQVDQAYNAHQTYNHTTRDAHRDVNKIVAVLLDKQATSVEDRTSPTFEDPTPNGSKMCSTSWMQDTSWNPVHGRKPYWWIWLRNLIHIELHILYQYHL